MGRWIIAMFGAATVALIFAAIMTVGGPQAARDAKFDDVRLAGLFALANSKLCEKGVSSEKYYSFQPTHQRSSIRCGTGPTKENPMSDPKSGNPYVITQAENEVVFCAEFQDASATADRMENMSQAIVYKQGVLPEWQDYVVSFEPGKGCLVFTK